MRLISGEKRGKQGEPERNDRMRIKPFVLLAIGFSWLATDLNLVVGNVVLSETRLGIIVYFLDRLPSKIAGTIDAVLGWIAPLVWGFVSLLRPKHR